MTTKVSHSERSQGDEAINPSEKVAHLKPVHDDPTVTEQLQGMVIDSVDVADFLRELCDYSAGLATLEGRPRLDCAVTLFRRRRALTGAGNSPRAQLLNEMQERMGSGPCLTALEEERTIVV